MKDTFNKLYAYIKKNFHIRDIIIDVFIISIIAFLCLYKFPYVIYKPGGTIDIAKRIYIDDEKSDIGSYNMAYVAVSHGNLPTILLSHFIKDWDLKKEEEVTITNTDYETTFKLEKIDMTQSMNEAIMVAYDKAGMSYEIENLKKIIYLIDDKANTDLKVLDEIISINGNEYEDMYTFREYINSLDVGAKVSLKVKEDGKEKERYAYVYESNDKKVIGIIVYNVFDLKTTPQISIKSKSSEAGSSGGLMLSLAVYDSITDGDLTKGKKIVGTGTIDILGNVGEIGGVKYKLLGAQKSHADIFFVPENNYKEAKEVYDKYNLDFELVMVKTFDDALSYLMNKN